MAAIQSYRDLEAWQRAMDLADEGYDLAELLPRREMFGLERRRQASRGAAIRSPQSPASSP